MYVASRTALYLNGEIRVLAVRSCILQLSIDGIISRLVGADTELTE
jgi:hypothetical protein